LISCIRSVQHPIGAYWADGGRQPLVQTFLRGGEGRGGFPEVRASRTCWISDRGVRPTFSPLKPIEGSSPPPPSRSKVTYIGRSYQDEPVGGLPSARGHFGQQSPIAYPICRGVYRKPLPGVGKESYAGETREAELPSFHIPLTGGRISRGGLRPPPFHRASSGTPISLSLLTRPHFFTRGESHLPPGSI
jgi:hypothetical protein